MSSIYVNSIAKTLKFTKFMDVNKNSYIEDCINLRLKNLIKNEFVDSDKQTLTNKGRASIKVILTGGVFDIIHPGHIHTLNLAKSLGDILIVVVATDKTVLTLKKKSSLHNQKQRCLLINSLKMVDFGIIGNENNMFITVKNINPEIIALGYDQLHQEKSIIEECKKLNLNVEITRLFSPVPEISSSKIETKYKINHKQES